ncbi:uncharacterized protein KQ657_003397 [Scheffersomyces spartinae]|uniref:DUF221-domain-containing protein n=1 Tax=Scheffersomyces spartinae TaxID=45513 RepID=A0A9P8AJN7_9ASCO|nr:uncharacterized protein KQ657_003397 [Scheffersomyces spartinae]KAG7195630.1 hypothetical protein KQ657_003397 [Scheffersomyces spartinae]
MSATSTELPHSSPTSPFGGYKPPTNTRVARYQIAISLLLGLFAIVCFSILRKTYPKLYNNQNQSVSIGNQKSILGWITSVLRIRDDQVLQHSGLDSYVFLRFFKMAIYMLLTCLMFAVTIISPLRYKLTGRFDGDGGDDDNNNNDSNFDDPLILALYTGFTYIFTFVILKWLMNFTQDIIRVRQDYLGNQNSITDRTVKLTGIPPVLRDEINLKRNIDNLNIGELESVVIVREWNDLNNLYRLREKIKKKLESYWVMYFDKNDLDIQDLLQRNISTESTMMSTDELIRLEDSSHVWDDPNSDTASTTASLATVAEATAAELSPNDGGHQYRPKIHKGLFGLFGPPVDAINYYSDQLSVVDKEILKARTRTYNPTSTAFITMATVAQAQMLGQTVLDPKVDHLITTLAPAPHDIIWENLCLTRKERRYRSIAVTAFIGFISVVMIYPVRYIASMLNLKTISKLWPQLGHFLKSHKWAANVVVGLLPTYLFTLLNIIVPFFYVWISSKQGFTSHGGEELASVSKNFFYIFVNLFLVFTVFGTLEDTTTTKIAYDLAKLLKDLSLFYVDLIVLQGLGMFPYKLLLLGNLMQFQVRQLFYCKTPRDYINLYETPVFNFGLQLPQPILILIITITYSIMSTRILTAGLLYFIMGYLVYKYQLMYACVHPPHSTGKVWSIIFRRIILGLCIFQLTMVGVLVLLSAYKTACFIAPLPLIVFMVWHNYEQKYIPLVSYIALRSISNEEVIEPQMSAPVTVDELRERNTTYQYPCLVAPLDGPVIGFTGPDESEILVWDNETHQVSILNKYLD